MSVIYTPGIITRAIPIANMRYVLLIFVIVFLNLHCSSSAPLNYCVGPGCEGKSVSSVPGEQQIFLSLTHTPPEEAEIGLEHALQQKDDDKADLEETNTETVRRSKSQFGDRSIRAGRSSSERERRRTEDCEPVDEEEEGRRQDERPEHGPMFREDGDREYSGETIKDFLNQLNEMLGSKKYKKVRKEINKTLKEISRSKKYSSRKLPIQELNELEDLLKTMGKQRASSRYGKRGSSSGSDSTDSSDSSDSSSDSEDKDRIKSAYKAAKKIRNDLKNDGDSKSRSSDESSAKQKHRNNRRRQGSDESDNDDSKARRGERRKCKPKQSEQNKLENVQETVVEKLDETENTKTGRNNKEPSAGQQENNSDETPGSSDQDDIIEITLNADTAGDDTEPTTEDMAETPTEDGAKNGQDNAKTSTGDMTEDNTINGKENTEAMIGGEQLYEILHMRAGSAKAEEVMNKLVEDSKDNQLFLTNEGLFEVIGMLAGRDIARQVLADIPSQNELSGSTQKMSTASANVIKAHKALMAVRRAVEETKRRLSSV